RPCNPRWESHCAAFSQVTASNCHQLDAVEIPAVSFFRMSNDTGENEEAESTATVFNRRDALRAISALGLTSMAGGAAWAALEFSIAKENITDWRKSVCRYCGTGCGVQVGMSGKKIVEVRGDEDAHNQ